MPLRRSALQSPPYGIASWAFDQTSTVADPGTGEFRLVGTGTDAVLAISQTSAAPAPADQSGLFDLVIEGDRLVVQRMDNALRYLVVDVGLPVDMGTWFEVPIVEVVSWITPTPNRVFAFTWRHVVEDEVSAPSSPAPLVPLYELDALVDLLVTALVAEVRADPVRDADKLDRAARAAIRDVEIHLDWASDGAYPSVYVTAATVDPQVFDALVVIGSSYLKRVGLAYGTAGYDEPDPLAVRARGAALAGITTGHKARFGVG